jgi:hypothetical protein
MKPRAKHAKATTARTPRAPLQAVRATTTVGERGQLEVIIAESPDSDIQVDFTLEIRGIKGMGTASSSGSTAIARISSRSPRLFSARGTERNNARC